MPDLFSLDRDQIKADRCRLADPVRQAVIASHLANCPHLGRTNCLLREAEAAAVSIFDLDKDQTGPLSCDQVDLSQATGKVEFNKGQTLPGQIVACPALIEAPLFSSIDTPHSNPRPPSDRLRACEMSDK